MALSLERQKPYIIVHKACALLHDRTYVIPEVSKMIFPSVTEAPA